jgi:DNA-binding response OmpR family regulator
MPKVLIVDNEESICLLYKEVLEENGIDSVYVHDVKEAFYLLSVEKFDLIIIEPIQYGKKRLKYKPSIAVLKEVRRRYKKISIIVNSSYPIRSLTDHLKSMGLRDDNFVVKSSDTTELLLRVFAFLHIKKELGESPNKAVKIFMAHDELL